MNKVYTHHQKWGLFNSASHCKMVISASDALNGKIVIDITNVEDAEVHVFLMPRRWN